MLPCLFWLTHQKLNHGLTLAQFCCQSLLQSGFMCMSTVLVLPTAADTSHSATLILAITVELQHSQIELPVCHRIQQYFLLNGWFHQNSSLMKITHLDSSRTNLLDHSAHQFKCMLLQRCADPKISKLQKQTMSLFWQHLNITDCRTS